MGNPVENLRELRDASLVVLESLRCLWIDRDGGFTDLRGRTVADHLDILGQLAFSFRLRFHLFEECFAYLARVSRKPIASGFVTASSTTEFVLKHCCMMVQTLDNTLKGICLQKAGGLTFDEKETYRKAWRNLREPFDNSCILPTYGKCDEMTAEVEWEYQRALGLLPAAAREFSIAPAGTIEVFFSYSHKDEKHRDALAAHLSQLKNEGKIRDWYDRKIAAGTEWESQITDHLDSAHIVLLLISADFLASKFCYSVEMKRAVERHENREARVIPVIIRACDWQSAPFGKIQALPTDGKAVTSWTNRDEAYTNVAKAIRAVIAEITAGRNSEEMSVPGVEALNK